MGTSQDVTLGRPQDVIFQCPKDVSSGRPSALHRRPYGDFHRTSFGDVFRTSSGHNFVEWVASRRIFRTLAYLRKFMNMQNSDIFKTWHIFRTLSRYKMESFKKIIKNYNYFSKALFLRSFIVSEYLSTITD